MKTRIRLLALLAVFCLIFCGCAVEDQTVTKDELTITVPGDYIDCSTEDYAAGYTLVYGSKDGAVMALKESFALFEELGLTDMTVQDYVQLLEAGYELDFETEEADGKSLFKFENEGNTYLVGVFAGKDAFWMIQAGCPSENFAKQEETFRSILNSVSLNG